LTEIWGGRWRRGTLFELLLQRARHRHNGLNGLLPSSRYSTILEYQLADSIQHGMTVGISCSSESGGWGRGLYSLSRADIPVGTEGEPDWQRDRVSRQTLTRGTCLPSQVDRKDQTATTGRELQGTDFTPRCPGARYVALN